MSHLHLSPPISPLSLSRPLAPLPPLHPALPTSLAIGVTSRTMPQCRHTVSEAGERVRDRDMARVVSRRRLL
jgi:hypothetical protein